MPYQIKSSARATLRPLIVTFSALALASLFSYAAVELTEPSAPPADAKDTKRSPEAAFLLAKAEAAGGDPAKLLTLANYHFYGIGTEKNEAEGARLNRIGAEKEDPRCMFIYGSCLRLAIGVKQDVAAGVDLIRKAAVKDVPEAEYKMHELLEEGEEVKADPAEARRWLLRAADHGHPDACADLAEEILQAKEVKRAKSVLSWVRPGALAGHARSCYIMGYVHSVGFGVKADSVEAMAWRLVLLNINDDDNNADSWRIDYAGLGEADQARAEKRAQELSGKRRYVSPFARDPEELIAEKKDFAETKLKAEQGDREAQYHLAELHEFGRGTTKDAAEAARWCRKAAEQGHAEAQFSLAQTLRIGDAVAPDMKEAFAWYMKAALQGNAAAEHALSVCYQEGEGVKADVNEARKWRLKAAENGEPRAQCNLGTEYFLTDPSPANDAMAVRWFRKAANQLHRKGCLSLGHCYLTGRGVPKDKIEGLAWMIAVGDELDADDKDVLCKIIDGYTEDEFKKAMARSKQLRAEIKAKHKAE